MPWRKVGRGRECTRHKTTFALTESCPECNVDPGPELGQLEAIELAKPPAGCMSSVQLERWFISLAKRAAAAADRLVDLPDQLQAWLEEHKKPEVGTVVYTAPEQIETEAELAPGLDFHAESNIAKHREVALKAMRAAKELALLREDAHTVLERERRMRKQKASH